MDPPEYRNSKDPSQSSYTENNQHKKLLNDNERHPFILTESKANRCLHSAGMGVINYKDNRGLIFEQVVFIIHLICGCLSAEETVECATGSSKG